MKKGGNEQLCNVVFACLLLFSLFTLSFNSVQAASPVSAELMSFYQQDAATMHLSNDTIVLYDVDQTILYYLYYNPQNVTLNITTSLICASKKCPSNTTLKFDYLLKDETFAFVKKAAGIFITSNQTALGEYTYNLLVEDQDHNYSQQVPFKIIVISPSLWIQFWHNLLAFIGFA